MKLLNYLHCSFLDVPHRLRLLKAFNRKLSPFALVFAFLLMNPFSGVAQVSEDWVVRYNGPANNREGAPQIAVDTEGNVYVTGPSEGIGTSYDYATMKFNASGERQWVARYNGPADGGDLPVSIGLDAEGNVYVTGASEGAGTGNDYATVKYNSLGEQQWVARYNGPANEKDDARSIAVDAEGNSYVTGVSAGIGSGNDYATLKYNTRGEQQWVNRYDGPGNREDEARAIAIDAEGNVYVTGASLNYNGSGTGSDYATLKYTATGRQEWVARYHGGGSEQPQAIVTDAEGNVYVTGISSGDYGTVKYNSSGEQQWAARYNGFDNLFDIATSLAVDPEGNVYVTGSVNNASGKAGDYATVKYNASGKQQWAAEYSGPANYTHQFPSLVVDPEGNVYVSGASGGIGSRYDFATLKYNTLGEQQWEERYNGPANGDDAGSAIAIDADRNIYVAGRSWGAQAHYDFAIVKYSQELNSAPVAADDAYETEQGVELTVAAPGILTNDTDAEEDALTASLLTEPANGSLILHADGSFSYTSAPCFHGSDSFTYAASDGTAESNAATVTITVHPVENSPVLTGVSPPDPQPVNTTVTLSASYTGNTPVAASFDWGDGSSSEGIITGSEVTGTHSYSMPDLYTVSISVTDACGEADHLVYEEVVVYDPAGGFVTGGGWFHSPTGAYLENPSAEGKAHFAFESRYRKEGVQGNLVFTLRAANLNFRSTAGEWLIITADDQAFWKGSGTLNGRSDHSFQVSVVDAKKEGRDFSDRIRMQIWDRSGELVYDNQRGAARNAEATMPIGGGAIVIHKAKKNKQENAGANQHAQLLDRIGNHIKAYPLPLANGGLWLEFPVWGNGIFQATIYDLHGRKVAEKEFNSAKDGSKQLWMLDHQSWPSGMYLLSISGEGFKHQKKITR